MDWNEFLRDAVSEKDVEMVRQALASGADPNHAEVVEDSCSSFAGMTPLFWAARGGSQEIARLLLDAGARVTAEASAKESSLHTAVSDANLPMVNLLLEHDGAAALNWFDEIDRTPLMIAVEIEHIPIARRLIEAGADVNTHDELQIGDTALHTAAANGTLEMVKLLLAAGADPRIEGWMRRTPLHNARGRKRGDGPRIYELLGLATQRF